MTREVLIWTSIVLLGIGLVSILRASSRTRTESEKKLLRGTAVGVDVAAAILLVVVALT